MLMNNSVYGKIGENLRKRIDVRLVTDQNELSKLASKPTYVNSKIFTEDLAAVQKIKETLKLDRPAYAGMCILDLLKTLVYNFHYNYIKRGTITRLNYYLQIQTAFVIKKKNRIFMRSYGRIEICLATLIIEKTVNFYIQQIKKLSSNLKIT